MVTKSWKKCKKALQKEMSQEEFNAWINPLEFSINKSPSGSKDLFILAPNAFIKEHVRENYDEIIRKHLLKEELADVPLVYELLSVRKPLISKENKKNLSLFLNKENTLNDDYTFETFVEGKSNNIALAAAKQVSESKNAAYNPLFIYGGVGLGKTHLMHAVGNKLKEQDNSKNIVYVHSERFVSDMVKCLQLGSINDFKNFYRSVDALLIDDIQFFAGKEQSQEELFHTFNTLLEGGQQMILTCDKYPKEIDGLEERLKSRLGWGLPVVIDPPELETRAAVLLNKANTMGIVLPNDCAIYIAQRIRSNIRELEGALKRVVANARFTNQEIDLALVKDALKDLFVISAKMVSIENIQKTVAEYYNIKLSDLLSKRRSRSITRPRQMAMALTKQLTNHSLPEIGEAFNGRDHTTVLHACKKITDLRKESPSHEEDYRNLNRALTN